MSAELRAVVLTYGTGREHEALLESLAGEGIGSEAILIVHNPSRPGENAPVEPGVEVVEASHNLGYAAGMNLGIERQLRRDPEYVLLLTHDARFRPGALRTMLAAAAASPEHGVLGPALLLTGTEEPFSFGGEILPGGGVRHRREPGPVRDGLADCAWVDGGTMLVRAEPLRRAGGFDERFWGYFEDAELCRRARADGYRVGVVVDAHADQDPGMAKRLGPWAYLMTRNGIAFARRAAGRRGGVEVAAGALLGSARDAIRALARLLGLRPGPAVDPWAVAVGGVRGTVDFCRGRWGPPPAGLPGGGDIGNVDPPGAAGDA